MQQLNFSTFSGVLRTFKHYHHFKVLLRALNLNVLNFITFKYEGEPCDTNSVVRWTVRKDTRTMAATVWVVATVCRAGTPSCDHPRMYAVACSTVTINQSLFATRFASWLFHYQISQIRRFSK